MQAIYADIIIDISHEAIDRAFQYEVPASLRGKIRVGMQVEIPFGKGNALRTGYVIGLSETPKIPVDKMKAIQRILPQVAVEGQLIRLAAWMRETYGSTMYQALQTVLPVKKRMNPVIKREICLDVDEAEARLRLLEYGKKRAVAKVRMLEALLSDAVIPYEIVTSKLHIGKSTIDALLRDGTIEVRAYEELRKVGTKRSLTEKEPELNAMQKQVVDTFCKDYDADIRKVYLLHGVTGSGKTEVYMHMIDRVILQGKQAIVLIPEIGLTFQTVMRFRRHFGNRVTILHSRLSDGERYDQYRQIAEGKVDICIGPRSALFAPFSRLGLIVIDEEHEGSYKSDNIPKFHARETAIQRASMADAAVVLGSATPSLAAYYKAEQGDYQLLCLPERAAKDAKLPTVKVVDMRDELQKGNRSRLSYPLQQAITDRLEKGEQSILFMNRRGYASFVSCRSCGEPVTCPHCQVSLCYHDHGNNPRLVCHYCGYEEPFVKQCKSCGSKLIGTFGSGTEQLEAELKDRYPGARVLRMDADTTKGKDGHEKILSEFADGKADILVGTQMVVKGHDYPNVTLMGIVAADQSLNMQDYMAGERTFQLLTQAAGRAGRGDKVGEVIVQTYEPDNPVIVAAAKQDYREFYELEKAYREMLHYPPIYGMLAILVTARKEVDAKNVAKAIRDYLSKQYGNRVGREAEQLNLVGPTAPVIGKINDIYRQVLYLKSGNPDLLREAKHNVEMFTDSAHYAGDIHINYDLDPFRV